MRFFIALEIPPECRAQIETVQQRLKELIPNTRLTNNDKLHLTIAFVGEQPEEFKDKLIEVIRNAVWDIPPFEVTPAYIDGFPNLHKAHVFWVGVKGDIDKLFVLRERIKDGLVNLGLTVDDRRYIPHIAIAKTHDFKIVPFQENQLEEMMMVPFDQIQIKSIKLFESIPQEGFHHHNTLAEVPLEPDNLNQAA